MNVNQARLPYLQAIKNRIQEAFPDSKVAVWAEDSVFFPGQITIECRVNECGAHMEIMDNVSSTEFYSDILIAKIKEVL